MTELQLLAVLLLQAYPLLVGEAHLPPLLAAMWGFLEQFPLADAAALASGEVPSHAGAGAAAAVQHGAGTPPAVRAMRHAELLAAQA